MGWYVAKHYSGESTGRPGPMTFGYIVDLPRTEKGNKHVTCFKTFKQSGPWIPDQKAAYIVKILLTDHGVHTIVWCATAH